MIFTGIFERWYFLAGFDTSEVSLLPPCGKGNPPKKALGCEAAERCEKRKISLQTRLQRLFFRFFTGIF
jgi:hypothetical protein